MLASPFRTYPLPATLQSEGLQATTQSVCSTNFPLESLLGMRAMSAMHHSGSISAASVSGPSCATRVQTTKLLHQEASAPAQATGPSLASNLPMRIIHISAMFCPRRSLASRDYQASQSRTSMRSLPLLLGTRPTCNNNDMRPKVRGSYLTSP
jgi:hypothetical protein